MPKILCTDCKNLISLSCSDFNNMPSGEYVCLSCLVVLGSGNYQYTQDTLFAPIGTREERTALGDLIMTDTVFRHYQKHNADENIIVCDPDDDVLAMIDKIRPGKIFVSEFACDNKDEISKKPNAIQYKMLNEVNYLARRNIFPRNPFNVKHIFEDDYSYIALHLRNIDKAPLKNVTDEEYRRLANFIYYDLKMPVVIVGNDSRAGRHFNLCELPGTHDLRNELTLAEVAGVLSRCKMFIGKDSGIAHLAAACGANVFAWGYSTRPWFPKAPAGKVKAFLKSVPFDDVMEELTRFVFGLKITE